MIEGGNQMIRINRTFLLIYNLLIGLGFLLRYITVGPVLFGQVFCYWLLLGLVVIFVGLLDYLTYWHPTPVEIVAYHVNLIMRHRVNDQTDVEYDDKNKRYLSERFIESFNYQFFYYDDCCAKTNQYRRMKIKLAISEESFNKTSIIIKTMDEQYIQFKMIKDTDYAPLAFLYEWEIDDIEYSDQTTFERMVRGY